MEKISFLTQSLLATTTSKKKTEAKKTEKSKFKKKITSALSSSSEIDETREYEEFDEEEIESLLNNIKDAGNILSDYPSMKNITNYKQHIKEFLNIVVKNSFELEKKQGAYNVMQQSRKEYTIINIIDKKLAELAEEIRKGEQSNIRILASVNEINGLIIDLLS